MLKRILFIILNKCHTVTDYKNSMALMIDNNLGIKLNLLAICKCL